MYMIDFKFTREDWNSKLGYTEINKNEDAQRCQTAYYIKIDNCKLFCQ